MGQVFLTLGAIILLTTVTMGINQLYLQSVNETVGNQVQIDAINFASDISERISSYAFRYDDLMTDWGQFTDESNPAERISFSSAVGSDYHATVAWSPEMMISNGQTGRIATITVFEFQDGRHTRLLSMNTAVTRLNL